MHMHSIISITKCENVAWKGIFFQWKTSSFFYPEV